MQNSIETARLKVSLVAKALKPADAENPNPPTYAELEGASLVLEEVVALLFDLTAMEVNHA